MKLGHATYLGTSSVYSAKSPIYYQFILGRVNYLDAYWAVFLSTCRYVKKDCASNWVSQGLLLHNYVIVPYYMLEYTCIT